jgi:hypothetical protein
MTLLISDGYGCTNRLRQRMEKIHFLHVDPGRIDAQSLSLWSSSATGAQMYRTVFCVALLAYSAMAPAHAQTKPVDALLPWQAMANCAAAYLANWKNRLSGYNRSPDMSNMIQVQSDDYKATAIRYYQKEMRTSPEAATEQVESYVATNFDRYIAMDKVSTLDDFIEKCPQIESEPPA